MAGKKKKEGKQKGKGKGGSGGVVDGVGTKEMTREQLEEHIKRLRQENEREREERNFFQLERDKLHTFWEITQHQLEEARAHLRNKDREIEEKEEDHQYQAKVFNQRVKHLLYEHQGNIAELKTENLIAQKLTQENYVEQERVQLADKRDLKEKLEQMQEQHQEEIRSLKMQFSQDLSKERVAFEVRVVELEEKYKVRMQKQREDLTLRHAVELTEVDERKNKQISDLIKNHEKAFNDMKNYYNDISLNNLALISSLKEQIEESKFREERMQKSLKEVQKENKSLAEPLKKAREEAAELSRQLMNVKRDKSTLASTRKSLVAANKEIEMLKWEKEILELQLQQLKEDHDRLQSSFDEAVLEIQQKAGLRAALLDRKVQVMQQVVEQREAQFVEIAQMSKLDPEVVSTVHKEVEKVMMMKNVAIDQLRNELKQVVSAYNNLVSIFEAKLKEHSIPFEVIPLLTLSKNF